MRHVIYEAADDALASSAGKPGKPGLLTTPDDAPASSHMSSRITCPGLPGLLTDDAMTTYIHRKSSLYLP